MTLPPLPTPVTPGAAAPAQAAPAQAAPAQAAPAQAAPAQAAPAQAAPAQAAAPLAQQPAPWGEQPAQAAAPASQAQQPAAAVGQAQEAQAAQPHFNLGNAKVKNGNRGPEALWGTWGTWYLEVISFAYKVTRANVPQQHLVVRVLGAVDPASDPSVVAGSERVVLLHQSMPEIFQNDIATMVAALYEPELRETLQTNPTLNGIDLTQYWQHALQNNSHIAGRVLKLQIWPNTGKDNKYADKPLTGLSYSKTWTPEEWAAFTAPSA